MRGNTEIHTNSHKVPYEASLGLVIQWFHDYTLTSVVGCILNRTVRNKLLLISPSFPTIVTCNAKSLQLPSTKETFRRSFHDFIETFFSQIVEVHLTLLMSVVVPLKPFLYETNIPSKPRSLTFRTVEKTGLGNFKVGIRGARA